MTCSDAEFIAMARTALPACIEEIRRLRKALKVIEQQCIEHHDKAVLLIQIEKIEKIALQALGEDRDG